MGKATLYAKYQSDRTFVIMDGPVTEAQRQLIKIILITGDGIKGKGMALRYIRLAKAEREWLAKKNEKLNEFRAKLEDLKDQKESLMEKGEFNGAMKKEWWREVDGLTDQLEALGKEVFVPEKVITWGPGCKVCFPRTKAE